MSRVLARMAVENAAVDLFERIGDFLREHHLSPDPAHYAFAHGVLTHPDSAVARSVRTLTDGGVRLSRNDIEKLGGQVRDGAPLGGGPGDRPSNDGLVAQTQMQVEGFTDMVQAMRVETEDFGRDLAARAEALRRLDMLGMSDVVQLTGSMIARVRTAETRLEAATHEASELRAKLEEARDNARRDPLTDLPNRRAFEEAFAASAASGARLCIAVCDVDRFKAVNDRFGHAVGDRVLKAIAEALSQTCAGHLVSRYGGEEFAILFSDVDHEAAQRTLNDARLTVAAKRYRLRGTDEPLGEVTFSAGLTCAGSDEPLASAFGRADALLYAAKNAGRNRLRADC
ncbi:GGDEF domain-containing protein [Sphingomonas hylomeconis]|uniref:diguanylate cyclase n=1 Tax=Sphingomonas hylomeconis TaxID=1395958 RepID=A0ABV7SPM4_9SPHN|nr:GGDEF domain-containing protein [Sphingomonas hylomeconis]